MKPILPFAARLHGFLEPYAYTLIRVATGAIFVPHGVQKLFFGGASTSLGYGLGVLELAGGAAVALGLLARPVALLLALDVISVIVANFAKGWLWTRGGVQYHVFLLGLLIAVVLGGAGAHAVKVRAQEEIERLTVPLGYAIVRVWMALLILPSGYEKVFEDGVARIAAGNVLKTGFYPPLFWAWWVAILELAGMLMLAAGLLTRPIAFMFFVEMAVITLTIQMPNGWFWTSRGCEFAALLTVISFAFVMAGGGRYSLDRKLGREF
jgi:putative oxidoreductase